MYVKGSSRNSRAFHRRVLASRAAREASSRHRGEAAMVSHDRQSMVLGSKVRRADTGGQTHANERGFGKSLCVTSTKVRLLSRDARTGAATKATGPSSSTRDSSVIAMDDGKENTAPPDGRALKVRGESSVVAPRILVSVVARVRRADAAPARRASFPSRRLPRASGAPTPRPRAEPHFRRDDFRARQSPCRVRAGGVALRQQRDAKRVETSANPCMTCSLPRTC